MIENNKVYLFFANLIFIIMSLFCLLPFIMVLSASFSDQSLLFQEGYSLLPRGFTLEAYKAAISSGGSLINAYKTTIIVTLSGTFTSLLFTSMLGYVINRKDFRLGKPISGLLLFAMLFSAGIVPSYIVMTQVYHLKDNILAMILPLLITPWNVFLMKNFMRDISMDLIEAARIDGAGEIRTFFQIVIPLSKPALATLGLLIAFAYWNDWMTCMMYIDNVDLTNLQYYMYRLMNNIKFLTESSMAGAMVDLSKLPTETMRMALCVLAAGPMLVVFPFFQRYFVRGLKVGSVKG